MSGRRRRRLVAAALVAAAIGGYVMVRGDETSRPDAALALRFTPGSEYEYTLSWQSEQTTRIADGGELTGRVDLRGRLIVHAYDGGLVGVRLADLTTHDVVVQDRAVIADAKTATDQLARSEAFVQIERDGAIAAIWFEPEAPPLFTQLVPVLAAQLEFRLAGGAAWHAASPGPFGSSTAAYARTGRGATRTRDAYATLTIVAGGGATRDVDARATLELAPAGHWQRIADRERVELPDASADVALALELVATRAGLAAARPSLAGRSRRMPGALADGDRTADHEALLDKAGGLTRAELMSGLASGGVIADVDRWFWRATGLVELDPALAAEVGELVASGRLAGKQAELALDLLAATGTPEAQRALCSALASPRVRAAERYGLLVQRVSLVAHPTAATAAFVGELYGREPRGAVAFALGAVARHLDENGDGAAAARLSSVLAGDLERAGDPTRRAELLGALGNAARADNVELVVRHATADAAEVRAAAARALRYTDVPRARETLHALFGDGDAGVQREAIGALAKHRLGRDDLVTIERSLATAGIGAGNEGSLVTLVADHLDDDTSATILRAIAARPSTLPELRARIDTLLRRRSS